MFPLAAHDKGNNIIIESDTIHHAVAGDAIEMPDMKYTRNLNIKSNPTKRFIESDLTKEIKSLTAITLGTGASVPLKHRNGNFTLSKTIFNLFSNYIYKIL